MYFLAAIIILSRDPIRLGNRGSTYGVTIDLSTAQHAERSQNIELGILPKSIRSVILRGTNKF